jgi:hypothetical protein
MKTKPLLLCLLAPAFVSCGAMEGVKTTAAKATSGLKDFSLDSLRPSSVDVVQVREGELKELPLGSERVAALEQSRERTLASTNRKRSIWSFGLPANFKEPTLPPMMDIEVDGSLLPPKS